MSLLKLTLFDAVGRVMNSIKKYMKPLPDTYRMLRDFYGPFNKRLAYMLGGDTWLKWDEELLKFIGEPTPNIIVH